MDSCVRATGAIGEMTKLVALFGNWRADVRVTAFVVGLADDQFVDALRATMLSLP